MKLNTANSRDNQWDLVIRPKTGWFDIDLKGLWRYRDLITMFVKRDFVTLYKQTILGPLWYIITPLFTTIVFNIIFNKVAQIPTDDIPPFLFYMSGNIMWAYFAACLNRTSGTFTGNAGIFGKVYFPRLSVPIAGVIINLLQFAIQFGLFACFLLFFKIKGAPVDIRLWTLALPVLLLQMALLGLGIGILISSITVKYRDLQYALGMITSLWMYATPIVYPLSLVPEWLKPWYLLNPMASIIECFRFAFLGTGTVAWSHIGISWAMTLFFLAAGILLFSRVERTFMDTV